MAARIPDHGERVPADPNNFLRDWFLESEGHADVATVERLIARHGFTYGWALSDAWHSLIAEGYAVREGDEWVWPMMRAGLR